NILVGVGFAAVLLAAMVMSGKSPGPVRGILWGLAGFAVFFLAPALGLPPALPGMAEANLQARQLWWGATSACTGVALWLIFAAGRKWSLRILGIIVLVLPHYIGAPSTSGTSAIPH